MSRYQFAGFIVLGFGLALFTRGIFGNPASVALGQGEPITFDRFADVQWSLLGAKFKSIVKVEGSVVLMAAPTKNNPLPSGQLAELPGKTIGFLYLSRESSRYKLKAGTYAVQVASVSGATAEVHFLDGQSRAVGVAPASIREAPKVETPIAFVDSSVCYRFDEKVTCI